MVIIGGDLNGYVGKKCMDMTVFIGNTEVEHVLEMSTVLDMIVCNIWFKKIDMKVIPIEEVVSRHQIVVSDVKMKP